MLLPTSPEFIALCQAQLGLLSQTLGADLGILYLTEEHVSTGETRLVPIVSVPENIANTIAGSISAAGNSVANSTANSTVTPAANSSISSAANSSISSSIGSTGSNSAVDSSLAQPLALPSRDIEMTGGSVTQSVRTRPTVRSEERGPERLPDALRSTGGHRLVLPLIHEEMVLGLLVTERLAQGWNSIERQQIEQMAKTLTLSCVLDQRSQWLTQRQQNQAQLQAQQHDLMDNLIHQFRNPLTALRTFGKLLMRRLPETDTNREVAASIVRESDRLQELLLQIDRAIDLNEPLLEASPVAQSAAQSEGRSEAQNTSALPMAGTLGETELRLEPCDVRSILQPLLVSAVAVAHEKGLELHTEFPEVLPLVRVSPSALREVLTNLVDNAVKYTPAQGEAQGEVHIRIEATPQELRLRVTDNGLGIPDDDLAQLFQRHFRGVQATTEIPGTGLGLSIARELIRQMQGDIQVFSPLQPEGWISEDGQLPKQRGVTFLVTLPTI